MSQRMHMYCEYCGKDIYRDEVLEHVCDIEDVKAEVAKLRAELETLYEERAGASL